MKTVPTPEMDPTVQTVELKLAGKVHHLCLTFASLNVAEKTLKAAGEVVNIFHSFDFDNMDASKMVSLLYAALITNHPETKLEEIPGLITLKRIPAIKQALFDAFVLSMAESDPDADPKAEEPTEK